MHISSFHETFTLHRLDNEVHPHRCNNRDAGNTALEALVEHAAAFSSKDNARYADNLSLPFVHLWPDGEILRYDHRSDVDLLEHYARAGLDAGNFGRTELDDADLILDWDDLKAFT